MVPNQAVMEWENFMERAVLTAAVCLELRNEPHHAGFPLSTGRTWVALGLVMRWVQDHYGGSLDDNWRRGLDDPRLMVTAPELVTEMNLGAEVMSRMSLCRSADTPHELERYQENLRRALDAYWSCRSDGSVGIKNEQPDG